MKNMRLTVITDNPKSWFIPYAEKLTAELKRDGHQVAFCTDYADVKQGDCAFLLSCERIVPKEVLSLHSHNIVVHASALPKGKGWSPMTWQILEGKDDVPITLFEAAEKVDSGAVYLRDTIRFEGHELIDELRDALGKKIVEMVLKFAGSYPKIKGEEQQGTETFYARRRPKDSEIDVNKTLAESFNQLRVVDNERYPAFFRHKGRTYVLKIEKGDPTAPKGGKER